MKRFLRALRARLAPSKAKAPADGRYPPLVREVYERLGGALEVPDVVGCLRVFRAAPGRPPGDVHRTDFVPGQGYHGMEDNDIRGFLDGRFLYGWNQATQKYVRTGRIDDVWGYGEYELFRALQRWDQVSLPAGATVEDVELELSVGPQPPESRRSFFLYPVLRDWNPGEGGTGRNNTTPPSQGEVWWNDAEYQRRPWGLPGASSSADVGPAPLARSVLEPGGEGIRFRSSALTDHVGGLVEEGRPLLFLIKLQDRQEDTPGSLVHLWSASEGDRRSAGRKPRLSVFWRVPEESLLDVDITLEHGRELTLPVSGGGWAEFVPGPESDVVELAGLGDAGVWKPLKLGRIEEGVPRLRLRAVRDPVRLGEPFSTSFRETWIRTAAPEDQIVPWVFVSPTGRERVLRARFDGDYTWSIEFTPDEVGRWAYSWHHDMDRHRYQSAIEYFDVVLDCLDGAVPALKRFLALVLAGADSKMEQSGMMVRFSKLQRHVMRTLGEGGLETEAGVEILGLLTRIREELGGTPVPDEVPLQEADPQPWQSES